MVTVGIIAEFNPFHNGHKYLISKAREITKADNVVCIISGDFTQAGNIAVEDKFKRAQRVIKNGGDCVIELPAIYAISSAEYFSSGAVDLLNKLKSIDYLCFGSETGNTEELIHIANTLIDNDEAIWDLISKNMKEGISFAEARQKAISEFLTEDEVTTAISSNNILGIEYIKELIKLKSNITPIAIQREENDTTISATKIRELIENKKDYSAYVPGYTIEKSDVDFEDSFNNIVKFLVRKNGREMIKQINEVTEGLENKIYETYNEPGTLTYEETLDMIKSKRYQMSKIKRIFLNILLDIKKEDFKELYLNFGYARILAINPDKKGKILSMFNNNNSMIVLTSISDKTLPNLSANNLKSIKLDIAAHNIYSIANPNSKVSDYNNKL